MVPPLVSVIVPIYRTEPYLARCLDSILSQTFHDIEVILIDDGSPDRCGSICDYYAALDSRVRVFHTPNRGVASARNLGLSQATGPYIGFVDSDDWIEPNMFEVLYRLIEQNTVDIAMCAHWSGTADRPRAHHHSGAIHIWDEKKFVEQLVRDEAITNHLWNKLFRREILLGSHFEEGRYFEDVFFYTQILPSISKVIYVEQPLYHYVERQDGICGSQKPERRWDRYDSFRARRKWILAHYPILDNQAVAAII
jgi:glycosyltransferase involved in cell wall biosynthesis